MSLDIQGNNISSADIKTKLVCQTGLLWLSDKNFLFMISSTSSGLAAFRFLTDCLLISRNKITWVLTSGSSFSERLSVAGLTKFQCSNLDFIQTVHNDESKKI